LEGCNKLEELHAHSLALENRKKIEKLLKKAQKRGLFF